MYWMLEKCKKRHQFLFCEIKRRQLFIYFLLIILVILWIVFIVNELVERGEMLLKDWIEWIVAIIWIPTLLFTLIAIFRKSNKILTQIDKKLWD